MTNIDNLNNININLELKKNLAKVVMERFINNIEGINLSTFYILIFIGIYFFIIYIKNNTIATLILVLLNIINIKLIKNYFSVHNYVIVTNEYTIPVFSLVIILFIIIVSFIIHYFRLNTFFITKIITLMLLLGTMLWFIFILIFTVTKAPATDIFLIPGITKIERFMDKATLNGYALEHIKNNKLNLLPDEIDYLVRYTKGYEHLQARLDHFEEGKIEVLERRRIEAERKLANQVDNSPLAIALGIGVFFLTIGVGMGVAYAISTIIY